MINGYPAHTRYQKGNKNYLWIYIHPRRLSYTSPTNSFQGGAKIIAREDKNLKKFMFLAPEELQDNVAHTWEPLENLISRVADKVGQARQSVRLNTEVHKVDTALVYQDSNRREVTFMIQLAVYEDVYKDVFEPVELLRAYSAPSLAGENVGESKVTNPYVFQVDTKLGTGSTIPLINIRHAALVAVQPAYIKPFIDGYPSRCELSLTFRDMEPLSKETFSRVSVSTNR